MPGKSLEDDQARFETLLAHVLDGDEKALAYQAAKNWRASARWKATGAKASFERNRDRPLKLRKRQPKRQG